MGSIREIVGKTPIVLAPMAGVTDAPFRAAVRGFGARLVYSEMVASAEVMRNRRSASLRLSAGSSDGALAVQIAGRDPWAMAETARMAESNGAVLIDINMGCPAKKVTEGNCGSALMREPQLAATLVRAVVRAVSVPVTVKMRLGWDDDDRNAPALAHVLEAEGACAFSVHGRTRAQLYRGVADWAFIAEVKASVSSPVFANGDVRSPADALAIIRASNADGVMVGRGAFGRPWVISQMQAALDGAAIPPSPSDTDIWRTALLQYRASLSHYGSELGRRVVRKHLGWYAESAGGGPLVRDELLRDINPEPMLLHLVDTTLAEAA